MRERRYAILIGMNEYGNGDDLPYCVKDVEDVSKALISQCRFNSEDIYTITDSSAPVKEQIDLAFGKIGSSFKKKQDLLFFYFSGHGEYDVNEGNSIVLFQDDTELSMEDILLRYFIKLTPKNQYLIVDACYSGSKVFFKSKSNPEKEIRRLNYNSSELCLMFATESKNIAIQGGGIENSYFTHFFLEAMLKKSLYDDDGFLTMSAIDNYIKKRVVEKSEFVQIPVSETRSSGYKVFCFDEEIISSQIKEETKPIEKSKALEDKNSLQSELLPFDESLSKENREYIQGKVSNLLNEKFLVFKKTLESNGANIEEIDSIDQFDYEDLERVYKHVIETARKHDVQMVDGLFEVKPIEKRKPKLGGMFGIMNHLYEESKPEFSYSIDPYSKNLLVKGIEINSRTINQINCGLIGMFFQGKFGFSLGVIVFNRNWSGTDYSKLGFVNFRIVPYLLSEFNESQVSIELDKSYQEFETKFSNWNQKQLDDVKKYKQAVKSSNEGS